MAETVFSVSVFLIQKRLTNYLQIFTHKSLTNEENNVKINTVSTQR